MTSAPSPPRLVARLLVAAWLFAFLPSGASAQSAVRPTQVHVVLGVQPDGAATDQWLALVRRRVTADAFDSIAALRVPLTAQHRAWESLIRERADGWPAMLPGVTWPYAPVPPPAHITVVLGNRGAEDAFTHDAVTIGFDLSALQRAYGDAAGPENRDRLDRFFRHEAVHLMQKGWWGRQPYATDTPLRAALADMWSEGLGNRESLSGRWTPNNGTPSAATARALEVLGPRLVARLGALACLAPGSAADALLQDLSSGPFTEKWGALPVALWLADDARADSTIVPRFVAEGPEGVWSLARRHLPPPLAAALSEVERAAARCARAR